MDMGQNEMSKAQLVTASEHAEYHRNDRDCSKCREDVQALVDIATNMPTKQNEEYYPLVVSVEFHPTDGYTIPLIPTILKT